MASISLFIIWTFLTLFGLFEQAAGQQGYSSYYSGTRDNPSPQNYNTNYGNQPGRSDYYGYNGVGSKGSSSGFNPFSGFNPYPANENYGRYGNSWNSNSYREYPDYEGYQDNRGSQNYPNPPTYSRYGDSGRYQDNRGSYGNQGNYDPNREILPEFGSYNYGNRENNQGYNGYYGDSRYDNNNDGGTRNTDPINSSDAEPNIPYRGLVDDYLRYAGVRNNFDKGYGYPEDNTGNRFFDDSRNFEGNSDNYRIPGRFGFHENTGGLRNPYEFYRNNGPYRDRFGNYGRYGDNREDMIGFRPDGGYRGRYENSLNSGNFRPFPGNYDDYRRYNPFRDYYDPYNRYDNNRFQPYQSPYQDIRSPYSGYGERYDPGYVGNRFFENENNADHGLENQEGNYNRVLENDTVGVNNRTSGDFSDSRGWGNDGFRPSNPDQSSNSGFRRWYPNFGNYDESSFPMPYAERREPFRNNERVPDDPSNINNNYGPNHGFYERAPSRKEENISQEQNSQENVSQEQNSEENVSQEQNSEENN